MYQIFLIGENMHPEIRPQPTVDQASAFVEFAERDENTAKQIGRIKPGRWQRVVRIGRLAEYYFTVDQIKSVASDLIPEADPNTPQKQKVPNVSPSIEHAQEFDTLANSDEEINRKLSKISPAHWKRVVRVGRLAGLTFSAAQIKAIAPTLISEVDPNAPEIPQNSDPLSTMAQAQAFIQRINQNPSLRKKVEAIAPGRWKRVVRLGRQNNFYFSEIHIKASAPNLIPEGNPVSGEDAPVVDPTSAQAEAFIDLIRNDTELQKEIMRIKPGNWQGLVRLGRIRGFHFKIDQIQSAIPGDFIQRAANTEFSAWTK